MMKSLFALVLVAVLSACTAGKEEKMEMPSKSEPARLHCIGRHVIELPGSFAASAVTTGIFKALGSGAEEQGFDIVVRATGLSRAQFAREIAKRRTELEQSGDETVNVFKLERKVNEDAIVFRVQEIEDAYVSEINLLRGSAMVTVRHESFDGKFLEAEEKLIEFSAKISDNSAGVLQGFCLGPVVIGGEYKSEYGSFLFRNGTGADFEVGIDTYAPDERVPLLARMSGPDSLLTIFGVKHMVLRTGERSVAGMRAHEWLGWAKITDEQDVKTLQFNLETMRLKPAKSSPSLTITFETAQPLDDGTRTKTLISDQEAIRIWDSVIGSIRQVGS